MELLIDTADLSKIERYNSLLPLSGVTTNPSIIKKVGKVEYFEHMRAIREIIGTKKTLHAQVVASDYYGMLKDAEAILHNIDDSVFIKIPVTEDGLRLISELKAEGKKVTATAIYSEFQAFLAIASGADYIAPYYNRMQNLDVDVDNSILEMVKEIERTGSQTKVLAASFKNIGQVNRAIENGAHAVTIDADLVGSALNLPTVEKAVVDFRRDWELSFGKGQTVDSLVPLFKE
ncbi:MAG TPA: fructose-6-phosphate aldolase [Lactovum miscens]|uniref:fructose-6-phosphate aldolase n=1 Tax=Lactovum miscens TaxID=190387 RepID=UPI002EDB4FE8